MYKAFYASLRGDVRSGAFLTFASYAFLTERRELAWAVLREVLGERRVEQEKLLLELGRLLHGFKKAGVVITSKDVERDSVINEGCLDTGVLMVAVANLALQVGE